MWIILKLDVNLYKIKIIIVTFDDNFIFYGAKVHIRKQIGNAVPPLLAKAIADQISNNLDISVQRGEN